MQSLARVLLERGWDLTGSDSSAQAQRVGESLGFTIYPDHKAENVPDGIDVVIHSDAIGAENPELAHAAERGTLTLSYFQFLGQLMWGGQGVAIAGTHGKSTTAAMATEILLAAGLDPTVVFGAETLHGTPGGRSGDGDLVLVEACEYRTNFLHLWPKYAVLLPVELDHFDSYATRERLDHAFSLFAGSVAPDGLILASADSPGMERITAGTRCRVESFGFASEADWTADCLQSRRGAYQFTVSFDGCPLFETQLSVPGRHNVCNALAAAALAHRLGVSPEVIASSLSSFRGVRRRLEVLGTWGGIALIDDYAHHPTEVTAALKTVRQMYPNRRVWCVFQPHQALRTTRLLDELALSLHNADIVFVTDIFRAREPRHTAGEATAADLADRIRAAGRRVPHVHGARAIELQLITEARPGDVILTMGAGDIRKISDGFIHRLRTNSAAG